MQVNLKVIGGKNDGRVIRIAVPEFVIGRGEQAHLRPSSELISRMHCSIKIAEGQVTVEDMGSRNGTFINEKQLTGPYVAKVGDVLRVGRLQFEILIDHVQAGIKKPKVSDVVEAAARTAAQKSDWTEESISDWLSESGTDESSTSLYETRQFALDETKYRIEPGHSKPVPEATPSDSSESIEDIAEDTDEKASGVFGFKKKKKEALKLPPRPKSDSGNTKDAAGEVLRKFFNQR
jgi:pSer/pThr/pTyr-binding forkhead associated (FHA) protein